uniref:Uncharacterized protein n=1 Tax=Alexandrium catenella TaxID=2925 RepID=A0A7S1QZ96_ALECA
MERRHVARDVLDEYARAFHSMAEGTRQLGMPSAVAETLDYMADATKEVGHVHLEQKPELAKKVLARFGELRAKLNDQLGAPPAITELDRRLLAPLMDKPGPDSAEVADLLAQACKQLSLPSVIPELFEYLGPIAAKGGAPEPQKLQGLLLRLAREAGAPEAVTEFGERAAALSQQTGGAADTAKLTQMVAQLLRKLGMPAFANIFSKVGAPMLLRGKQPDPLTLALVAPSLAKVLPESEIASSIVNDMRAKLLKPVLKGYETAVERLTENMPDSVLKTGFKQLLALSLGVSK